MRPHWLPSPRTSSAVKFRAEHNVTWRNPTTIDAQTFCRVTDVLYDVRHVTQFQCLFVCAPKLCVMKYCGKLTLILKPSDCIMPKQNMYVCMSMDMQICLVWRLIFDRPSDVIEHKWKHFWQNPSNFVFFDDAITNKWKEWQWGKALSG